MDHDLELKIPPRPEYVRVARHVVGWLARMREVPDPLLEDVRLLASEAVTNAVLANEEAGSPEPVVLRVAELDGSFRLEVLDQGDEVPNADVEFEVDTGEMAFERGTWLAIVEGIADELTIEPREGGGTVLRATVSA